MRITEDGEKLYSVTELEQIMSKQLNENHRVLKNVYLVRFYPNDAKAFLELHFLCNRQMSEANVRKYAFAMYSDTFDRDCGESVILDKNAKICDGHHRLLALSRVANDNYYYDFYVKVGQNRSLYYDTGKRRTAGDGVSMMEDAAQCDIDILAANAGKALKVFASLNGYSSIKATVYLGNAVKAGRDMFTVFNSASEGIIDRKTRKSPKNGFSAAVLDQFLKGRITSTEVTHIYELFDRYTFAYSFKNKDVFKFNEYFNMAQNLEITYFGTKKVWSSAINCISDMKAGSQQKDCMYLISEAITNSCVVGKDSPVAYSSSPKYSENLKKFCKSIFNVAELINEYELLTNGEDKFWVSKVLV